MSRTAPQEICEVFSSFEVVGYNSRVLNYLHNEVFCQEIYYFQASTKAPLIVDCGANIGMSILYFKLIFPDSEIIAFEANPFAFRLLSKNIKANGLRNIRLHNVALYNEEVEVFLHIGNNNVATPLAEVRKEKLDPGGIRLNAKRLSHFIRNVRTIDLIKIDVEGAEIGIVNDLVESRLLRKAEQYIVEFHHKDNSGNDLCRFLEKFETNGFSYNIRANVSEDKACQDKLIYFHKRV